MRARRRSRVFLLLAVNVFREPSMIPGTRRAECGSQGEAGSWIHHPHGVRRAVQATTTIGVWKSKQYVVRAVQVELPMERSFHERPMQLSARGPPEVTSAPCQVETAARLETCAMPSLPELRPGVEDEIPRSPVQPL